MQHIQFWHDLSFNINIYLTSFGHFIVRDFGEFYNVSGTSFVSVYIWMTLSERFVLPCDFTLYRFMAWRAYHEFLTRSVEEYIKCV